MKTLSGSSALVIGGGTGVGRATVLALAREGARVVAVARSGARLEAVQREAPPGSDEVRVLNAAVASALRSLVDETVPELIVLSAGARPGAAAIDQHTWESFSEPWNTDTKMAFHLGQAALGRPLRPGSTVIFVSSGAGLAGSPISGGYAGAKRMQMFLAGYLQGASDAGGLGLRSRRRETRALGSGIRQGAAGCAHHRRSRREARVRAPHVAEAIQGRLLDREVLR